MARRGGVNDLIYYAALGGIGWVGYKMALDGQLGPQVHDAVVKAHTAVTGRPPATGDTAGAAEIAGKPLNLWDLDGQPLLWDGRRIRQRPPGANVYQPSQDAFVDEVGVVWLYGPDASTLTRQDGADRAGVHVFIPAGS